MNSGARFLRSAAAWLLLVAVFHALAVWALPRVVMHVAMARLTAATTSASATSDKANAATNAATNAARVRVVYPPLSTAASRVIVLPSPDLAYALCVYDLSKGPVNVDAAPEWPAYWSVALYAANTDNYLVRNDREASARPVHWRLLPPDARPATPMRDGREPIVAPAARGLVLMRVLVADRELQGAAVVRAQRALHCVKSP